jgi:hypothetical protein
MTAARARSDLIVLVEHREHVQEAFSSPRSNLPDLPALGVPVDPDAAAHADGAVRLLSSKDTDEPAHVEGRPVSTNRLDELGLSPREVLTGDHLTSPLP